MSKINQIQYFLYKFIFHYFLFYDIAFSNNKINIQENIYSHNNLYNNNTLYINNEYILTEDYCGMLKKL